MDEAMIPQTEPPPKGHSPAALRLLRAGWLVAFFLIVALITAGIPVRYREIQAAPSDSLQSTADPATVKAALVGAGISLPIYAAVKLFFELLSNIPMIIFALLIFRRRSGDFNTLWMSFTLLLIGMGSFPGVVLQKAGSIGEWATLLLNLLGSIAVYWLFFLFPNGRFIPRWTRWFAGGSAILLAFVLVFELYKLSLKSLPGILFFILAIILFAVPIYAQVYRYRRVSTPIERLQTRWAMVGLVAIPVGWILDPVIMLAAPEFARVNPATIGGHLLVSFLILQPFYLLFPIGLGFGLLRYRLYDIDVIIRRTLVWGAITVLLGLVYFGGVTLFQSIFTALSSSLNLAQAQSPLGIVLSTLAIAALFNPLRKRLQEFVDRRFYRRKYDAEQALASFAALARQEVDLEQISARLIGVVEETVQPESVSLWLRPASGNQTTYGSQQPTAHLRGGRP